jgi:hypothetical protein
MCVNKKSISERKLIACCLLQMMRKKECYELIEGKRELNDDDDE